VTKPQTRLKTYSHLAAERRQPSEYEIVTTRLHHHVERGFEVDGPVADWHARHVGGSRWQAADWDRFADPRETTYTKYTRLQQAKEAFVDGLLASIDQSAHDRDLPAEARALLARTLPPLRFVFHGLQMAAAYVGQMAPSGRITIAAGLQAADELRRVHRFAYRMAQLRRVDPAFGDDARAAFQTGACWQPLRRVLETLLVTWDWAEAFVALDVCLKPALDELFLIELGAAARERGDFVLGQVLSSLDEDCQWQRRWTAALAGLALAARPENRQACADWTGAWVPQVAGAVQALAPLLDEARAGEIAARVEARAAAFRRALAVGLEGRK
jgi:toluene monooxygenase system protein E